MRTKEVRISEISSMRSIINSVINFKPVTHNFMVELVWTITPIVLLLFIVTPSFSLLYAMGEIIEPTLTVKVIGNQWYWSYEFSDFAHIVDKPTLEEEENAFYKNMLALTSGWFPAKIARLFEHYAPLAAKHWAHHRNTIGTFNSLFQEFDFNKRAYEVKNAGIPLEEANGRDSIVLHWRKQFDFAYAHLSKFAINRVRHSNLHISYGCRELIQKGFLGEPLTDWECWEETFKPHVKDLKEYHVVDDMIQIPYLNTFRLWVAEQLVRTYYMPDDHNFQTAARLNILDVQEIREYFARTMTTVRYPFTTEQYDAWLPTVHKVRANLTSRGTGWINYLNGRPRYYGYTLLNNFKLDWRKYLDVFVSPLMNTASFEFSPAHKNSFLYISPTEYRNLSMFMTYKEIFDYSVNCDTIIGEVKSEITRCTGDTRPHDTMRHPIWDTLETWEDSETFLAFVEYKNFRGFRTYRLEGFLVDQFHRAFLAANSTHKALFFMLKHWNADAAKLAANNFIEYATTPYPADFYATIKYDSYITNDSDLVEGGYRLLETDIPLVLPINVHIRFLVTSNDVLHSFAVPSLGIKIDATPGRICSVPVYISQVGRYFGQCSEICGTGHAFMPIYIVAVKPSVFEYFIEELWMNKHGDDVLSTTPLKG